MRFEPSDRVTFRRNPLAEVICQVRFPRILRIEAELPAAFQERIQHIYRDVDEKRTIAVPDEVAQILGAKAGALGSKAFDFLTEDRVWKVSLTSGFLALSTTRYEKWEEFKARLIDVLDAFEAVYGARPFTRVGLRYRDVIRRSSLGIEGRPWRDLLRDELLGELLIPEFAAGATHAVRELVLAVDIAESRVRLFHGLVELEEGGEHETCYMIDSDFFRDQETERTDAQQILDEFHVEAGRLFRWCIRPDLHQAMEPISP